MIYEVELIELELCGCSVEGSLTIKMNNELHKVYYQTPDNFILNFCEVEDYIPSQLNYKLESRRLMKNIDLRLVYGCIEKTQIAKYSYPISDEICGGEIFGKCIEMNNKDQFRVDCGFIIDIENEVDEESIEVGDFVRVTGTYMVYFPNTEYTFEY